MPTLRLSLRTGLGSFFLLTGALFSACSSTPHPKRQVVGGLGGDLPKIQLVNPGSSHTPPHHMSMSEYPFDAAGNYIVGAAR